MAAVALGSSFSGLAGQDLKQKLQNFLSDNRIYLSSDDLDHNLTNNFKMQTFDLINSLGFALKEMKKCLFVGFVVNISGFNKRWRGSFILIL